MHSCKHIRIIILPPICLQRLEINQQLHYFTIASDLDFQHYTRAILPDFAPFESKIVANTTYVTSGGGENQELGTKALAWSEINSKTMEE